mgnify:CR=1 FL=1
MIQLPDVTPFIDNNWKECLPYIHRFMERRNLTYQHEYEKGIYLYQNNETGAPYFLILVFFDKMGTDHLKFYLHACESTVVRNIILIYQNIMTTNCLKVIQNLFQYDLETFSMNDFRYDITQLYYYVPHEKVIQPDIVHEIRQKYGTNLPTLLKSDPIVKYFGFRRNDIIKITRSENEFVYRLVR